MWKSISRTIAAAVLAVLYVATPAHAAYYQVSFCHVETAKNKTVTETQFSRISSDWIVHSHFGPDLQPLHGDYWGNCDGSAVVTKPGNRKGHKK